MSNNHLNEFDLQQIDADYVAAQTSDVKDRLILTLVDALKEALDRLNQNSQNSSRPPRTENPWQSTTTDSETKGVEHDGTTTDVEESPKQDEQKSDTENNAEREEQTNSSGIVDKKSGKPGRRKGMKGHGRKVDLDVSGQEYHHPERCAVCDQSLSAIDFIAWTALYVLDLIVDAGTLLGLQLTHTKHIYTEIKCTCGHINRAEPGRCKHEEGWEVQLTEWHLVGPMFVAFIVCLNKRMRCSRRLTQEFLIDWFGVNLSTSTINQCIHEAGRAVAPVEDQMVAEIKASCLLFGDETTWKEAGKLLWLWVFCTTTVTLFLVGYRSKEIIQNLLGNEFYGWLMSDGYVVYRDYLKRLRCWAHLIRKAKGLVESLNHQHASPFGMAALELLKELTKAVYQAREGPLNNLQPHYHERLMQFKQLCESNRDCPHAKTRALAREFLNDWDAIWAVLRFPWLPMTNNEAERALRHWVISRLISHGTRTEQGTRAFGLLASVIDTCRKRGASPWPYIAEVVAQRRQGNQAPPLPVPASV